MCSAGVENSGFFLHSRLLHLHPVNMISFFSFPVHKLSKSVSDFRLYAKMIGFCCIYDFTINVELNQSGPTQLLYKDLSKKLASTSGN